MAENISKLYRSGLWYNDTIEQRFKHVQKALSDFCNDDYDDLDLAWHIKNAVIGGVYISERVFDGIKYNGFWNKYVTIDGNDQVQYINKETDQYAIIKDIVEGKAVINNGVFDDKYLEIRKWTRSYYSNAHLHFEHVIPAKVYIAELIRAYKAWQFDLPYFMDFRKNIRVCIVLKKEENEDKLDQWRESMPQLQGKENLPLEQKWQLVLQRPFARYEETGVCIHGL